MITLTIDNLQARVEEGCTILQAAREHGISIPTLCYHEAMEPFGACRLCVVEVETGRGRQLVSSCTYPCSDGLVVRTNSEAALRSRRTTVELLMASSGHIPIIRELAAELGVGEPRFAMEKDDCILCGLCVRACHEIVGVGAISVVNRGIKKKVSPPFHIASNVCIGCGTCVLVCPTRALTLADITGGSQTAHLWESEFQAVNCRICGNHHSAPQFVDHSTLLREAQTVLNVAVVEAIS
jgi:NADH dehydrogenase/NADH:ubiquinone oxidoreductase subunit G